MDSFGEELCYLQAAWLTACAKWRGTCSLHQWVPCKQSMKCAGDVPVWLCQPFGVFWNVKEWGRYGFRLGCWASHAQQAHVLSWTAATTHSKARCWSAQGLLRNSSRLSLLTATEQLFWSSDHSSVMLTQYQFATLPKWNSAGEKKKKIRSFCQTNAKCIKCKYPQRSHLTLRASFPCVTYQAAWSL